MAFGSVVHKVFERIELDKLNPQQAYELYEAEFEKIKAGF